MKKLSRKTTAILPVVLAAALAFACSEATEDSETLYMEGELEFECPRYIGVGELLTTTVSGITYPEDPLYKWYVSLVATDTLRTTTITVNFPDSIGDFVLNAYAEHSGFYRSSSTFTVTTIDPEESFTGLADSGKYFFDWRDGQQYPYVTLGSLDWFARNLSYTGAGVSYENSAILNSLVGRYYTWEETTGGVSAEGLGAGPQGVCPEGWSVPTAQDWEDLALAVSGSKLPFLDEWEGLAAPTSAEAYINDEKMWAYNPDNDHNNSTGWNAVPSGYCQAADDFASLDSYGLWWSSTQKSDLQAYYRYQYVDMSNFPVSTANKDGIAASVRCVRIAR